MANNPIIEYAVLVLPRFSPGLYTMRFVASLVFYWYAFYLLAPTLFPSSKTNRQTETAQGFRVIAATTVMALSVVLTSTMPLDLVSRVLVANTRLRFLQFSTAVGFGLAALFTVASAGIFYTWLWVASGGSGHGEESREFEEHIDLMPGPLLESDVRQRLQESVSPLTERIGLATVYGFVSVLAAGFTSLISMLFPLPEIVVLIAALAGTVSTRSGLKSITIGELGGSANIPRSFYRAVGASTQSEKGFGAIVLLGLGTFLAAVHGMIAGVALTALGVGGVALLHDPSVLSSVTLTDGIRLWNVGGVVLLLVFSALHSLWFWNAMALRLPKFLERWDRYHGALKRPTERTAPPSAVRPYANLTPVFLVMALLTGFDVLGDTRWPLVFAVVWPVTLVAGGPFILKRTSEIDALDQSGGNHHLYLGFVLQTSSFALLLTLFPTETSDWLFTFVAVPIFIGGIAYYLPDVNAISSTRPSDPVLTVSYLLTGVVFLTISAMSVSRWIAIGIPLLTVLLILKYAEARYEAE